MNRNKIKNEQMPCIRISSIFIKSIIILLIVLGLPNMFIISQIFASSDVEFNPNKYSEAINKNIKIEKEKVYLTKDAKKILLENNIWIQFVNSSLNEIYSYNKSPNIPTSYSPIDFVNAHKNDIYKSTVFIFEKKTSVANYSYFLGFKNDKVIKHHLNFNPTKLKWILKNIIFIFIIDMIIIIIFAYLYFSKKLGQPIQKITKYIFDLSKGNYDIKIEKKSIYKEVFICIETLKNNLKENKIKKELFNKSREKWISYISHDMKTPLSSIKGFAELLKDDDYEFSKEELKRYCNIIYNKSLYMEELINDLNFSYKLKNGSINLKLQKVNLVNFLRELINELLLNPNFKKQHINFINNNEMLNVLVDINLIKRAFSNLIINFLIYNSEETRIELNILEEDNFIKIILKDNGRGMSKEEVDNIFEEYFRGTNTNSNPNGSGLGMAIANELIKLHKGKCFIKSKEGIGTTLEILLCKI